VRQQLKRPDVGASDSQGNSGRDAFVWLTIARNRSPFDTRRFQEIFINAESAHAVRPARVLPLRDRTPGRRLFRLGSWGAAGMLSGSYNFSRTEDARGLGGATWGSSKVTETVISLCSRISTRGNVFLPALRASRIALVTSRGDAT